MSDDVGYTDGMLELHFLPPHSAPLNPAEQVWKSVKECVAEHKPLDKVSLQRLNEGRSSAFQLLQRALEVVLRHPDYALKR